MKSHAEIRAILQEYDQVKNGVKIFGNGEVVKANASSDMYEGLGKDGTAMVMNIEMNKELNNGDDTAAAKKEGGKGKGKTSGGGGGGNTKGKGEKKKK